METIKITSEIPLELYDKVVVRAHDINVDKDTLIRNALQQYLEAKSDGNYYNGDYLPYSSMDIQDEWILKQ